VTCPRTVDAGAYVLGALPPAQRLEFHQHLATCPDCRAEVAELAGLPGLLGRLDAAAAAELDHETSSPAPSLLPAALGRLRTNRRRQRWRLAAAAAALVLVAGAGAGAVAWRSGGSPPSKAPLAVTLSPMQARDPSGPVQAQIALVPENGGTRIQMHCVYLSDPYEQEKAWNLKLVVFPKAGSPGPAAAEWTVAPGTDLSVSAKTPLSKDQIDWIELQRGDGTVLLSYTVA
jgi:anti-sigma-K factor RskA